MLAGVRQGGHTEHKVQADPSAAPSSPSHSPNHTHSGTVQLWGNVLHSQALSRLCHLSQGKVTACKHLVAEQLCMLHFRWGGVLLSTTELQKVLIYKHSCDSCFYIYIP